MAEKKPPAKKRAPKKAEPVVEAAPVVVEAAPVVIEAAPVEVEAAPVRTPPTHEQIARRAYEIYKATGRSAFENWIAAERELRA